MAATAISAAPNISQVAIGRSRGFYSVLGESAVTAPQLARLTSVSIDSVREWLVDQVKQGYVVHDPVTHRFATWCAVPATTRTHQIAA